MTQAQLIEQINKKNFHPIYFLEGEEGYFIDEISNILEDRVLREDEKSFNFTLFYGRDSDANTIMNTCRQYPMGADHQLVILKEGQSMNKVEGLLSYIEKPLKSTVLVICYKYGKLDRRTQFAKVLIKNAIHFESKKLYDDKIPGWIANSVQDRGYFMDNKACQLMADYLGNDLGKISGELDKLTVGLEKGKSIDITRIESNIGISREYNVFELGNALGKRDYEKIYQIIFYFCANPKENPLVLIVGFLGSFFSKILSLHYLKGTDNSTIASKLGVNPYFVNQYELAAKNFPLGQIPKILSAIRLADVRSKGVGTSPNIRDADILKELIYSIIHA